MPDDLVVGMVTQCNIIEINAFIIPATSKTNSTLNYLQTVA